LLLSLTGKTEETAKVGTGSPSKSVRDMESPKTNSQSKQRLRVPSARRIVGK